MHESNHLSNFLNYLWTIFSVNLLFTVEHCSQVGEIKNIHSIVQFQKDTLLYIVMCHTHYQLLHGHFINKCRNKQWIPDLRCISSYERNHSNTNSHHKYGDLYFQYIDSTVLSLLSIEFHYTTLHFRIEGTSILVRFLGLGHAMI